MAPDIIRVASMAETILQVMQISPDPLMPAALIHCSSPQQTGPDTFTSSWMQCVEYPVLHSLLVRITVSGPCTGILICPLILISDLMGLPIFETSCFSR